MVKLWYVDAYGARIEAKPSGSPLSSANRGALAIGGRTATCPRRFRPQTAEQRRRGCQSGAYDTVKPNATAGQVRSAGPRDAIGMRYCRRMLQGQNIDAAPGQAGHQREACARFCALSPGNGLPADPRTFPVLRSRLRVRGSGREPNYAMMRAEDRGQNDDDTIAACAEAAGGVR